MKRLRLRVSPMAHRHIKSLPTAYRAELDSRLSAGETPRAVGQWLQVECRLLVDIKFTTLTKLLERYRATELRDKAMQAVVSANRRKPLEQVLRKLNAMEELHDLAVVQRGRLEKLLSHELPMPKGILLQSASAEVKAYREILVALGHLQLETGVITKAGKRVSGQVLDEHGNVKTFNWTEEQEILLRDIIDVEHTAS